MHLGKRPQNCNPSCEGGTNCKTYQYWQKQQGKTVRIARGGSFIGTVGRLQGLGYHKGEIVYRTGHNYCVEYRRLWISYEDLELTGQGLGLDHSRPPECECHVHCCCSHTHHC